ncbi:NAD(P)H-hydrate dehydratase [bacterium]|nr:NAD(P)H-hydrate dehydratase [bacterium]
MRPFLSVAANRAVDDYAINHCGIPGEILMKNAGTAVVSQMDANGYLQNSPEVLIITGKGNNGGDGYVIAAELIQRAFKVSLIMVAEEKSIQGDALRHFQRLSDLDLHISEWKNTLEQQQRIQAVDIIVDALFGTGISGEIREPYTEIINNCNRSQAHIIAVDVPSGVSGNRGDVLDPCIKADLTVSMGYGKLGCLFEPARSHCGKVVTVEIGFPDDSLEHIDEPVLSEVTAEDFPSSAFTRLADAHKYSSGKIFIIAGSPGFTGAAILASTAALRSGAGLVKLALPESLGHIGENESLETIIEYLPETQEQSFSLSGYSALKTSCDWADSVVIGPGIGRHPETQNLVRKLIANIERPLVIDADALFALTGNLDILTKRKSPSILTPHLGEFKRLLEMDNGYAPNWEDGLKFAREYGVYLLLKGAPSILASPNGSISVNSSGYSGMATAGSGDVLSGLIASLWGQWNKLPEVFQLAIFIHGKAAELNRPDKGVLGLIASDIVNSLPLALKDYGGLPT